MRNARRCGFTLTELLVVVAIVAALAAILFSVFAHVRGTVRPYEPPRHGEGNNFAFVEGHVQGLRFPGGRWVDGGPRVVPEMSMYSRTGQWEERSVP